MTASAGMPSTDFAAACNSGRVDQLVCLCGAVEREVRRGRAGWDSRLSEWMRNWMRALFCADSFTAAYRLPPWAEVRLPVTESEAARTLALPFFNKMKSEEITEVCATLLEVVGKARKNPPRTLLCTRRCRQTPHGVLPEFVRSLRMAGKRMAVGVLGLRMEAPSMVAILPALPDSAVLWLSMAAFLFFVLWLRAWRRNPPSSRSTAGIAI